MHCKHEGCRKIAVDTLLAAVAKSKSAADIEKNLTADIVSKATMSILIGKDPIDCVTVAIVLAMDCKELLIEYQNSLTTGEKANEVLRSNILHG